MSILPSCAFFLTPRGSLRGMADIAALRKLLETGFTPVVSAPCQFPLLLVLRVSRAWRWWCAHGEERGQSPPARPACCQHRSRGGPPGGSCQDPLCTAVLGCILESVCESSICFPLLAGPGLVCTSRALCRASRTGAALSCVKGMVTLLPMGLCLQQNLENTDPSPVPPHPQPFSDVTCL